MAKERQKHDYTDELELKSLLIREKNRKLELKSDETHNKRINELVATFVRLKNKRYKDKNKRAQSQRINQAIKKRVVALSEETCIDQTSRERFGVIVLLMIKNILKKRNFSGYTWRDEFYSESCHNIFKYIHSFDHTIISKITKQPINSFSYVTQIIHNAILTVIKNKTKQKTNAMETAVYSSETSKYSLVENQSTIDDYLEEKHAKYIEENTIDYRIEIEGTMAESLEKFKSSNEYNPNKFYNIIYPKKYLISLDEYQLIKPLLTGNINIIKSKV